MNVKEVLGAFLLVNNPIVLSEEETKDVQKAIKQLQQENKILKENAENNDKVVDKVNWENMLLKKENKQLKYNWNKLKEYCKENLYFYSGLQNEDLEEDTSIQNILEKMQELEKGDSNDKNNR